MINSIPAGSVFNHATVGYVLLFTSISSGMNYVPYRPILPILLILVQTNALRPQ